MSKKVKFSAKRFDVENRKGKTGINYKKMTVGVLPYVMKDGLLHQLGILHEWNTFRQDNYCHTLITGTVDPEDTDYLMTAKRELLEEGGIKETNDEKWIFLGSLYLSKGSNEMCHLFAVDVTDSEIGEPQGDGSKSEEKSDFSLMLTGNAITITDESLVLASFARLFDFFYQQTITK